MGKQPAEWNKKCHLFTESQRKELISFASGYARYLDDKNINIFVVAVVFWQIKLAFKNLYWVFSIWKFWDLITIF